MNFDGPYRMHNGALYRGDEKLVCPGSEVALAYDRVDGKIWQHGPVFDVQTWLDRARRSASCLATSGLTPHEPDFQILTLRANATTCARINACLADPVAFKGLLAAGVL